MGNHENQADTILMSPRESALYNLGVLLGTAQGLAGAATSVRGLAENIRVYPAGRANRDWCHQAAQNVRGLVKGKKQLLAGARDEIGTALEAFGDRLLAGQEELAKVVEQLAVNIEIEASKKKTEFAAVLPTIVDRDANPDKQPGGPPAERPGLGKQLLQGLGNALIRESKRP